MAKPDKSDRELLITTEGSAQDIQEVVPAKLCRICGAVAINCNFGVISCESCKAFFRRNANNQTLLLAAKCKQGCIITKETRTDCKKCRLQKCFKEGMDKALILSDEQLFERRKRIRENKMKKHKDSWMPATEVKGSKIFTFQDAFIQSCTENISDEQLHTKIRNRLKIHCSNRLFGRTTKTDSPKAQPLNSFDDSSEVSSVHSPLGTSIEEPIQELMEETIVAQGQPCVMEVTQELPVREKDDEGNLTHSDVSQDMQHYGTCQNQSNNVPCEISVESSNTCDGNPIREPEITVKNNQTSSNDSVNEMCLSDESESIVPVCDSVDASQIYGNDVHGIRTTSGSSPVPMRLDKKRPCHEDVNIPIEPLSIHLHSSDASVYCGKVKRTKIAINEPKIQEKQCKSASRRSLKRHSEVAKTKASEMENWKDEAIWMLKEEIAKRQPSVQKEKLSAENILEEEHATSSVSVNSQAYEMWSSTSVAASVFRETATADFQLPFTSCLPEVAGLLCPEYSQVLIHLEKGCSRALDKPILGKFFENPTLVEFFNQCEGLVPVYVSFAKCLQGFSTIPLEVQIDLVKSSFVCFLGLYCLPRFDSIRKTITMTTCADDFKGTVPMNTSPELVIDTTRYNEVYDFAVNPLQCDTFIILLTMCFFLFSSHNELLEKYDELRYWSQLYLQMLNQYVLKKYPSGEVRPSDIDDFLLKVKQAAGRFSAIVESVDLACVKPMVRELYE